jgi:hypothetical protein
MAQGDPARRSGGSADAESHVIQSAVIVEGLERLLSRSDFYELLQYVSGISVAVKARM